MPLNQYSESKNPNTEAYNQNQSPQRQEYHQPFSTNQQNRQLQRNNSQPDQPESRYLGRQGTYDAKRDHFTPGNQLAVEYEPQMNYGSSLDNLDRNNPEMGIGGQNESKAISLIHNYNVFRNKKKGPDSSR